MKKLFPLWFLLIVACSPDKGGTGFVDPPDKPDTEIDEAVLDDIQRRHFNFFWNLTNARNGMVPDRASATENNAMSSIAATGMGLTVYIVGVERGFITREQAAERTLTTLRFFATQAAGHNGFFYHFLDRDTGARVGTSELSTIDTALLFAGALSAQSYFDGANQTETEIRELTDRLFLAVDWKWAMNGGERVTMGWTPEGGFLPHVWSGYNEAMILYILAVGSGALDGEVWARWTETYRWESFYGYDMVDFGPLFGHQYSHLWVDFRGIRDSYMRGRGIDYFENSRRATLANRAYCTRNPSGFPGYGENMWGLTACDGPGERTYGRWEYRARGASAVYLVDDGTIAPTAAAGSFAFIPQQSYRALTAMMSYGGGRLYGANGFYDSFNAGDEWVDRWWLGIDQGPIVIAIENYRTELIWDLMKRNPYVVRGLRQTGFTGGWLD